MAYRESGIHDVQVVRDVGAIFHHHSCACVVIVIRKHDKDKPMATRREVTIGWGGGGRLAFTIKVRT